MSSAKRTELVQLAADDDATSVRDRLSFYRGVRVLLVWPQKGRVLARKLDLVLVQREAMRRALQIALVTHDAQIQQHAADLNISTFETVGASERARWRRARARVFTNRFQRPADEPDPEELQTVASRVRARRTHGPLWWHLTRRAVALLLVLLSVGALLAVVLPSATVTIHMAREALRADVQVLASAEARGINVEAGTVPLVRLRVETTQLGTTPTTGQQALRATTATGTVVFVNRTVRAISIPTGTTLSTSAGEPVRFRTTQDAQLAGGVGLQAEVPVEALVANAGPPGNVDAGQINVVDAPFAADVTVRNLAPTTGGDARTAPAATRDDMLRLEAIVLQQLQATAFQEMQARVGASQRLLPESVRVAETRVDWKTFSANPGDLVEDLTLTLRAAVEADALDERAAQQVAFAALGAQVPPGRALLAESVRYSPGTLLGVQPDGTAVFSLTVEALLAPPLDPATVTSMLAAQPLGGVPILLSAQLPLDPANPPSVTIAPAWLAQLGRMPLLPLRIRVVVVPPTLDPAA